MSRRSLSLVLSGILLSFVVLDDARGAAQPKAVAKCQVNADKAGAKFIAAKLAALGKCTDGIYKCVQTVDEAADAGAKRSACVAKARRACLKSLAKITAARAGLAAAVTKACASLGPGQVTGPDGLGFGTADCSKFGVPAVSDVASAAQCLAAAHDCAASRLFSLQQPRARELLQFTPPEAVVVPAADAAALVCLGDATGTGADVDDVVRGKSLTKCQKSIHKIGAKLASGRLKTLGRCAGALLTCAATKTGADLATCRDKARAGCVKALAKLGDQAAGLGSRLAATCGDPALFADLKSPAGSDLASLSSPTLVARAILEPECERILVFADYQICVPTETSRIVDDLVVDVFPRADDLLAEVGCDFAGCNVSPTPGPTPNVTITQIIDASGDGNGTVLTKPRTVAVDAAGHAYVVGANSNNVFEIQPDGTKSLFAESTAGFPITFPVGTAVSDGTNVYVISGRVTGEVYKFDAAGTPSVVIDENGDGVHPLPNEPYDLAIDAQHDVYVAADAVFKVTPQGAVSRVLSLQGSGIVTTAVIAVDGQGNVYLGDDVVQKAVMWRKSDGQFVTLIDDDGDEAGHGFEFPGGIAVDSLGTVYVSGADTDNVFKIVPGNTPTEILSSGTHGIFGPGKLLVDGADNLFVVSASGSVHRRTPTGQVTQIIGPAGDGTHPLVLATGMALGPDGTLFVTGADSNNAFRVELD